MLMDISSGLYSLKTRERSTSCGPERHFRRRSARRNSGNQEHWWHREAAYNSISSGRKQPSREVSSAVKAAIMVHGSAQWTTVLPTILLGFCATWKEDLQATTAEMIYGASIRLPGEFLCVLDHGKGVPDYGSSLEAWKRGFRERQLAEACLRSKELVDIPAGRKRGPLNQTKVLDSGEENSSGSSSRQEIPIRSGRRVMFNSSKAKNLAIAGGGYLW
ncbi:hypothetical protein NPIL_700991 [Nephila pilipes]|uniref:Uncharacterized protein n=1 Tax=Nephila pilipes TaxID=299642 RepID=A0A8X6MX44_NEPPI|nr:hypothetical protein NPIL_700991 [Nephila pilipes]